MTPVARRPAAALATLLSSRRMAVVLTCALLVMLAIAGVIPQDASPGAAGGLWEKPAVHAVIRALALDRVVTSRPFALLLAAAAASMAAATARHARVAYRRTFTVAPRGHRTAIEDVDDFRDSLRRSGFLRISVGDGIEKHVRNPWGYWGGVVLHVGLLLTVGAGLVLALTEWRGVVPLAEGESFGPASRFAAEQHGLLAKRGGSPETFTVEAASAEYWPDHTPRQVETTLAFPKGELVELGVNHPVVRDGVRYYQGQSHGHSFLLVLTRQDGTALPLRLDMRAPVSPTAASYFGTAIPDGEYGLRAKYFLDAKKRSMSGIPLLVLRLEKDSAETARAELRPGETARIGPYEATLEDAVVWTELFVVRDFGLPWLFLGFAGVVAGSALLYLTPPATVHLSPREDGRYDVTWEPSRFASPLPEVPAAHTERNGDAA